MRDSEIKKHCQTQGEHRHATKAKDSGRRKSKNCTSVTKKIIYGDVEDPVITLNGGDNISVFVGNGYEDQGVTVSDNCDTNIQSKVVVDGGVNSNQVGNYEITYSVEDDSHNKI